MKKTVSMMLVCVLLVCSLLTLVSCGKSLSGTYKYEGLTSTITYEFQMGGKVTKTTNPVIGKGETVEGEYEFNDEGNKITLTFNDESFTHDFVEGEESGVKYIKLDLFKYDKID